MNTDAMQVAYGFVSAALLIGTCALISEYGTRSDVSEEIQWMTALCLPMVLWAVVLAGNAFLFG